jgi:hypothetical protein
LGLPLRVALYAAIFGLRHKVFPLQSLRRRFEPPFFLKQKSRKTRIMRL